MTDELTVGDKMMEIWKRGDTKKELSQIDKGMESQPRNRIPHSIEEILKRPSCVRKENEVHRNWSVIRENSQVYNQHPCTGMFFSLTVKNIGSNIVRTCVFLLMLKFSLCQ